MGKIARRSHREEKRNSTASRTATATTNTNNNTNNNENNNDGEYYFGVNNHATVDDEGINSNEIVDKVAALRRKLDRRGHSAIKKAHLDNTFSRLDRLKELKRELEHRRDQREAGFTDQYRNIQARFADDNASRGSLQGYGSVCSFKNNNNNNNNCGNNNNNNNIGATPSRRLSLVQQVLQHAQQSGAGSSTIQQFAENNSLHSQYNNNNNISQSRRESNKQFKITFCEGSESRLRAVRSLAQQTLNKY